MKIILGSSSPRRKQILSQLFNEIEIIPPHINESALPEEPADVFTMRMSHEKNEEIIKQLKEKNSNESLIITSDTIVEYNNIILQKPVNHEDAFNTLKILEGKSHNVITGIAITHICKNSILQKACELEKSPVYFKKLNGEQINNYLSITEYMDKAGAYAIQENGDMIIEKYEGSHTNIIGFPLRLFFKIIADMNLIKSVFDI